MGVFMHIHHVSIIISDIERSKAFYCEILGLELAQRPQLGFDGYWLKIGDAQIHLLQLDNPDPVSGRPEHAGRDRHLALQVDDLDMMRQKLEMSHIPFTLSRSGRKALFCRDPDGNGIELLEG